MRILWVKAGGLVPLDSGGRIRSYNILRQLAGDHRVTYFGFHAEQDDAAHAELKEIFERVVCCPLQLPTAKSFAELVQYGKELFSREPYAISKYCQPWVARDLRELVKSESYDVIVCDFLVAAGVIPWDLPCPKVLFTHNVEALIWKRHYEVARNPLWKLLSWREWRAMARAERRYLSDADHVLAVSQTDRDYFAQELPPGKLTVIPTGVDVEYFRPMAGEEEPNSLVFTGSMDWMPNEDGIFYFAEEILPRICEALPTARLSVVGRKPSPRLKALAATDPHHLHLTGWVDDIRPYLAQSAVCIVPLRVGSGTRLKIFEAMGMGKAIVSTTIGAEGLPVRNGAELLLADSPDDFAKSVVTLLGDAAARRRLGDTARELVATKYSWGSVAREFAAALEQVVAAGRQKTSRGAVTSTTAG
jgi:glycosyltransferase involved in cell wall biosynthesis